MKIDTLIPASDSIQKGPIEGILIVNGRPQVEKADMPTISFESIRAILQANSEHGLNQRG